MNLKIERIEGKYLKPGDLFSEHSADFFANTKLSAIEIMLCVNPIPHDDNTYYKITLESQLKEQARLEFNTQFDPLMPPGLV